MLFKRGVSTIDVALWVQRRAELIGQHKVDTPYFFCLSAAFRQNRLERTYRFL